MSSAKLGTARLPSLRHGGATGSRRPRGLVSGLAARRHLGLEAFTGYRGTEVYPPADSQGDDWVVVIQLR